MSDLDLLLKLLEEDEFDEIPELFSASTPEVRGEFMKILDSRLLEENVLLN